MSGDVVGLVLVGRVVVVDVVDGGRAADMPVSGVVVVRGFGDHGVELDVRVQVVALGHVLGIAEDLGLAGIALGPLPFLL